MLVPVFLNYTAPVASYLCWLGLPRFQAYMLAAQDSWSLQPCTVLGTVISEHFSSALHHALSLSVQVYRVRRAASPSYRTELWSMLGERELHEQKVCVQMCTLSILCLCYAACALQKQATCEYALVK